MHNELTLDAGKLFGFLLVLFRMAGALVFVPLPGDKSGVTLPRVVLALGVAIALFPRWPSLDLGSVGFIELLGLLLAESALGVTIGVAVGFITETFMMGAQILSLQAGFGYASMVDPTTQAESGALLILARLLSGMLFFSLGLDRQVLMSFSASLDKYPPGAFAISAPLADQMIKLGSVIFSVGFRLVLPVVALLLMVDIALALLGRINSHLQLISLIFPAKILTSLVLLTSILVLFPRVFSQVAATVMQFVGSVTNP